ncbi:ATP synthase f chain, mitochondrial precursor [Mycoemilia scoparia]|uniref:ATP synthase f chain, mitochondrial n=1 Tax=Mycoemilia scoparia TaxID=417184 RepID=A0A9W8A4J2_9FUNG|nr:ATP synthase f chain, mitochondrial precursor [Mycoemilia scoparia]
MNNVFRSVAFKRGYSTLRDIIPPNIAASARQTISSGADATASAESQDFSKLISFYRRLPKGNSSKVASSGGLWARYQQKYFTGEKPSPKPIVHAIFALLIGGYSIHYAMHIRHHKNHEHH